MLYGTTFGDYRAMTSSQKMHQINVIGRVAMVLKVKVSQ
jgi:hypothetical protein